MDQARAHTINIEFFVPGQEKPIAERDWPCLPRQGDQVYLRELQASLIVESIFWGEALDSKGIPIADQVTVAARCVHAETSEDHPAAEPKAPSSDAALVARKLAIARGVLYDVKFAFDQTGSAEFDSLKRTVMDTLDLTTDGNVAIVEDQAKTIKQLEEEVQSLRRNLARVISSSKTGAEDATQPRLENPDSGG